MENNSSILRKVIVTLFVVLCFILQCSVFNSLALGGIIPNLMIILTSSFGFMRGEKEGLLIGFFSGLLCDIFFGSFLGFYERQFVTREEVNKDVIVRFERLLDEYFDSDAPLQEGLPTVKYFADKVFLSANYFGDMIKKQTGQTASEYIQKKLIERAKETLLGTDKTTSEIAYELGFQYPQHLSRMFKRMTGCTPNEFRSLN